MGDLTLKFCVRQQLKHPRRDDNDNNNDNGNDSDNDNDIVHKTQTVGGLGDSLVMCLR